MNDQTILKESRDVSRFVSDIITDSGFSTDVINTMIRSFSAYADTWYCFSNNPEIILRAISINSANEDLSNGISLFEVIKRFKRNCSWIEANIKTYLYTDQKTINIDDIHDKFRRDSNVNI